MPPLDLDVSPDPAPASPAVLDARQRRALVVGLGGGRETDAPMAKSSFAERRLRDSDTATGRFVDPLPAVAPEAPLEPPVHPAPLPATRLQLEDALVVPAGALMRGYLRCRALLLAGHVVGNVHVTGGPVVVRSGASLKGRLVATGDVYVSGTVGDTGGGAVITTRGKLTLAPGARVDGDVRSARLALHEGAVLRGVAKGCEE